MSTSESVEFTPMGSPRLESDSSKKRKLDARNIDSSPVVFLSTPSSREHSAVEKDCRRELSVVTTTPQDFRVFSSENIASLYKRRKLQTEDGKSFAMNVSPFPGCSKYRDVTSNSSSPDLLASKGFSVYNSPRNEVSVTPINMSSNRCDLFDDGSIDKYLNARGIWQKRLETAYPGRNCSSLPSRLNFKSRESPLVRVQSSLINAPNNPLSVTLSPRSVNHGYRAARYPFAAPNLTPLCKRFTSCINMSTPVPRAQVTPVFPMQTEEHGRPNRVGEIIGKSLENLELIGDLSKDYLLPTVSGKNPDIPSVSPNTMAKVLNGEYDESFMILDCRYPYEYEGGHIIGAKNFYTKKELTKNLFPSTINLNYGSRPILIFHCEFSSERGPSMYRFVRQKDRKMNAANYPSLFYPEMYVLEGGYCAFYACHKELCDPQAYKIMRDEENSQDLIHFRKECKAHKRRSTAPYEEGVTKLELPTTPKT